MRTTAIVIAVSLAAGAGCIPSYPVAEGELDRYWLLTGVEAETPAPAVAAEAAPGGFRVPTRWTIRQHKSLIWSTVSIVRAMDRLKAGTDEVSFAVSPGHARAVVDILAEARAAMADLREMVETSGRADRNRWADLLARALVRLESVSRRVTADEGDPPAEGEGEPLGMAGEPMLELVAHYLNDRSEGGLLADLSPAELGRLRDVLTETAVKLGFEVAGKEPSADVRREIAERMRSAEHLDDLRAPLAKLLAKHLSEAPPAAAGRSKRKIVVTALKWAPRALKLLESFLSQWDQIESITVSRTARGGRPAVAVTIAVRPGGQVRLADVYVLMPTIVFRGSTRILVLPDAGDAGETVVAFDPVGEGGAVELRFEGIIYGLVKLLALPLASGPIREVRVSSGEHAGGQKLLNVAVLTEAEGDRRDARRMLVVHDARTQRTLRRAFSVETLTARSETHVTYITPSRRYTYRRAKQAPGQ